MKPITRLIRLLQEPFGRASRLSKLRSLRGAQATKNTILELLDPECPSDAPEAVASAVLSGGARHMGNQARSVLWDVTPVWLAAREGRRADVEALWFLELGIALSSVIPLELGIFDLCEGTMKTLPKNDLAGIRIRRAETLEWPPNSRLDAAGDRTTKASIIVSVPHGDLRADRISCILRPRLRNGSLLIAVIRNFDVWNSPEWFGRARCEATRAMHRLYFRCASRVLTEPHFSHLDAESVIEAVGRKGGPAVSRLPLSISAASPPMRRRDDQKANPLIALKPHDPRELAAIIEASRASQNPKLVLIGTELQCELDDRSSGIAAKGEDLEIEELVPELEVVRVAMQSAASLLVPRSRADAELWLGEAARYGVPVFASAEAAISEYWREIISGYVDSSKPDSLARGWVGRRCGERLVEVSPEVKAAAALEQIAMCIRDLLRVPAVVRTPSFAHQGVFYCLTAPNGRHGDRLFGSGLDFREGGGWTEPTDDGTGISRPEAILRFRLWSVMSGMHRCMILIASSRKVRGVVTAKLHLDGESVAVSQVRVSPSELKWIRLEFDPGSRVHHDVRLAIGYQLDDGLTQSADSIRVIGWFIHPLADDVAWCEFLRDASAGRIPAALRAHRKTLSESLETVRDSEFGASASESESRTAVPHQTYW